MKNRACEIGGVEVGTKKGRRNEVSLAMICCRSLRRFRTWSSNIFRNMAGPIEISWQVH